MPGQRPLHFTLAHLSDLHFGREIPAVVDSLAAELGRRRPDAIVISGDFTQRARRREFRAARAFVDRLPVRPLMIPGNHDLEALNVARRIASPLRRYRRYLTAELEPTWERPGLRLLGLNTTRRAGWYLDWSRGRISVRQMHKVLRFFGAGEPGDARILVTHHPFARKPGPWRDRPLVTMPDQFPEALAETGVDLILSGHFHHGHVASLTLPGGATVRAAQAGTATSSRLKGEPNSFNWIEVRPAADRDRRSTIAVKTVSLREDGTWRES